jgi:hypothetical protein
MKAWRSRQPLRDRGVVGRPVLVQDHVEGLPWRRVSVDDRQELQPLLVAMARITGADYGAVEHRARREQAGGAVRLVVMRQGAASPLLPRHARVDPIQRVVVDRLNVSIWCGCQRCASSICATLARLTPWACVRGSRLAASSAAWPPRWLGLFGATGGGHWPMRGTLG